MINITVALRHLDFTQFTKIAVKLILLSEASKLFCFLLKFSNLNALMAERRVEGPSSLPQMSLRYQNGKI
ncbi:hypothetical protein BpHYR1_037305 [Brachionus plicatilis]|uniref:Uncharacterized protein n=1 Tax=Brachionus plicatilis TaxID=10195 RepID=A0A3M7RYK7_BRAPC|nr:hypothetical protein BpHYR1_037305 [Brachionus plicatilis]